MELSPVYEKYRIFRCSDCDPAYDDPKSGVSSFEHAYEIILPVDRRLVIGLIGESCPVDYCPRCGSYLSLCSDSLVTVTRAGARGGG